MATDDSPQIVWLSTGSLRAGIDVGTGALAALETVTDAWSVIGGPRHGQSFRLLAPLPDRRHNYVNGVAQDAPQRQVDEGERVRLEWDGVRSEHGGVHDVGVTLEVTATDDRLVFTAEIENRSELVIENVHYPSLGNVAPPDRGRSFHLFGSRGVTASRHRLWPQFDNCFDYCGFEHPTLANGGDSIVSTVGTPVCPFVLLEDGRQGIYVGVDQPSAELVAWIAQLQPGYGEAMQASVPAEESVSGHIVATRFDAVHVPYVMPGERRTLTPIAIQAFTGDWHSGADIYVTRRSSWMSQPARPAWVDEPHSWHQVQLKSAEDHRHTPFSELPTIAEECLASGVSVIQLVGWTEGGQDRNSPSHDPDRLLGGAEELRAAITKCQDLGVRVVLFTKFTWADRATSRFRDDLVRLAVKDPYGDYYMHRGWRYHTGTQMLDINTRRLVPMCFHCDEWVEICRDECAKAVDLGADGVLYDESQHHNPTLLCFDTSHGHRYGAPTYARDRDFAHQLRTSWSRSYDDFLLAGEANYDWEFEEYQLAYHRSADAEHVPLMRYLRPDVPLMTAITGFDDRNMVNQCLLYRYVMSYEPFNFKGRMTDFSSAVAYGRQMDQLRTELREWFWDGTFRDTLGAEVHRGDGEDHHPYGVFLSAADGRPAVAVANYDLAAPITVTVQIDDANVNEYRYRLVDDSQWRKAGTDIVLPARSAAVVVPAT